MRRVLSLVSGLVLLCVLLVGSVGCGAIEWTERTPLTTYTESSSDVLRYKPDCSDYTIGSFGQVGCDQGCLAGSAVRFPQVDIPQGATVWSAYMRVCSDIASSSTVHTYLYCELSPDAQPFGNETDWLGREMTGNVTDWTENDPWEYFQWYNTGDFSAALNEVVNQPDWESGNAVVVVWEDWEGRTYCDEYTKAYRKFHNWYEDGAKKPRLIVEYSVGEYVPSTWDKVRDWFRDDGSAEEVGSMADDVVDWIDRVIPGGMFLILLLAICLLYVWLKHKWMTVVGGLLLVGLFIAAGWIPAWLVVLLAIVAGGVIFAVIRRPFGGGGGG